MVKIDGWIITILERFCHWVQRVFGVRSAHLANATFMLASFWLIRDMISGAHKSTLYLGWFILLSFFFSSRQAMNRKQHLGSEATANPLKADRFDIIWRVTGLMISGLCFFIDWESKNFWFEASVLGSYFAACDDLPIAPSKLKQWLGSFNRQPELQPVESEC